MVSLRSVLYLVELAVSKNLLCVIDYESLTNISVNTLALVHTMSQIDFGVNTFLDGYQISLKFIYLSQVDGF